MKTALTVCDTKIRQDAEGRYCLNDLHRAAGEEQKHRPKYWLENDQTRALANEIEKGGIPPIQTERGRNGGTYVCKELVYAYAMWISPKFNLQVIRAYDALVNTPPPAPAFALPQSYPEALRELAASAEKQQALLKKIEEDAPKVEFFEVVDKSDTTCTLNEAAKVLGMGEKTLRKKLKERCVFQRNGRTPYQTYVKYGYFKLSIRQWRNNTGYPMTYVVPLLTGKGMIWLQREFGIKPDPQLNLSYDKRNESPLRGQYYRGSATDRVLTTLKEASQPLTNGELMAQAGCTRGEAAWAIRILRRDGLLEDMMLNDPTKHSLYKKYSLKHNGAESHHMTT